MDSKLTINVRHLRSWRMAEGFTQREVADAMGIPHGALRKFECGERVPRVDLVEDWTRALERLRDTKKEARR